MMTKLVGAEPLGTEQAYWISNAKLSYWLTGACAQGFAPSLPNVSVVNFPQDSFPRHPSILSDLVTHSIVCLLPTTTQTFS
jgi:hypothetical protein